MIEDKQCPTCGREDFKSRHGMKLHHSRAHNESIEGEEVDCANCGATIRRSLPDIRNSDNFFCDTECMHEHRISDEVLEHFPDYDGGGTVTVECESCGKKFENDPWSTIERDNVFCSKNCHGEWISENVNGEDHPNYSERITVNCENCGEPKKVTEFDLERCKHHFCDEDCMYSWREGNWVGENAPAWSGGTARKTYGKGWSNARERCLKRDFHRCRMCNISENECRERYGEGLHVHHRTPFKLFESSKKANRLRNLISLCKSCHHQLEWEFGGRSNENSSGLVDKSKSEYQATLQAAAEELNEPQEVVADD